MLPSLSQIKSWDVDHLTEAATHWSAAADRWESVFHEAWQQSRAVNWKGQAANALQDRTSTDKSLVGSKADQLRQAAAIARKGAGDIDAAHRRVVYAVEDASNAGFKVGEDLSVTDMRTSTNAQQRAARRAQAQAFAADIQQRATTLVTLDNDVAANLAGTAANVGDITFPG
jgi:oligoendopeptidase F